MNSHSHICYLSYDGILDPLGQSQILPYIINLNKNQILNFSIISFEKKENYKKISQLNKSLVKENIIWIPLKYTKNPPIISTLLDIAKLNFALKKLFFKLPIDLLHCRSYITSIAALKVKKNLIFHLFLT